MHCCWQHQNGKRHSQKFMSVSTLISVSKITNKKLENFQIRCCRQQQNGKQLCFTAKSSLIAIPVCPCTDIIVRQITKTIVHLMTKA